ncbi:acyltransferase family protein [Novosphingobium colocasiae]|uniref:Acyltransferase n=1 Tax=Novosphingobium colocasiae TaxID=1256513 RepID=A0A918UEJ5_9SPHN|nr:acyltransferase family protein [Novosphingobium colocasiae]GGY96711.1 acyltransferase [Novosphingobium colocasiae]
MKYRAEIDGLRAVAVLPVILFHAGFPLFRGGFVGVDVFFVISGFLITTILVDEIAQGRFSIAGFYERRARRILPALFAVMALCLPFAWAWLMPGPFRDFSRSIAAVSLFASNVEFWQESGYFAAASETKPLLHTWSLAVEEQYYVVFPLFLAAFWRLGRTRLTWLVTACALASLLLSEWAWRHYPNANYFLAPTRVWELFAGSIAALEVERRGKQGNPLAANGVLAMVGLIVVIAALLFYGPAVPFPSVYALPPILGVVLLLLFARRDTLAGRILAHPALVGVGLISYSAYLWHQPLFAFARVRAMDEPGHALMAVLALASLGFGYLSWRFVERPFRKADGGFSRGAIFAMSGAGLALFLALGVAGASAPAHRARIAMLTPEQRALYAYVESNPAAMYRAGSCLLYATQGPAAFTPDCAGDGRVVVWGDSHAAAIAPGLRRYWPDLAQYTAAACPPLLGRNNASQPNCAADNAHVLDLIRKRRPQTVILAGNWMLYQTSSLEADLARTISALRAAGIDRIYVLGSLPQFAPSLPERLIAAGIGLDRAASAPVPVAGLADIDTAIARAATAQHAQFVSLLDLLCGSGRCAAVVPDGAGFAPLAWDSSHLTSAGSDYLAARLAAPGTIAPLAKGPNP